MKRRKEEKPVYALRLPAWVIAYIRQNDIDVKKIITCAVEKELVKNTKKIS